MKRKDQEAALAPSQTAGRAQLGGCGWRKAVHEPRPEEATIQGQRGLEPDDRDKEDLQLFRSQPLQEAQTPEWAEATDSN